MGDKLKAKKRLCGPFLLLRIKLTVLAHTRRVDVAWSVFFFIQEGLGPPKIPLADALITSP